MMSAIDPAVQAENLRRYFTAGKNTVTRERVFFNRLSFDLMIAAARADYHLNIYEPDVDRDGFDIVVEDQENGIGWFQLKAVLRSAKTAQWITTGGFLRPSLELGEAFGFDLVECGRGGGVILIEIDDTTADGEVIYSYTDFNVLAALEERYLIEASSPAKAKGRPKTLRATVAAQIISQLRTGDRNAEIALPRAAFLEVTSPDGLLALMGMWSAQEFAPFGIHQAYRKVTVDAAGLGIVSDDRSVESLALIRAHMQNLTKILTSESRLKALNFTSPYATRSTASP